MGCSYRLTIKAGVQPTAESAAEARREDHEIVSAPGVHQCRQYSAWRGRTQASRAPQMPSELD